MKWSILAASIVFLAFSGLGCDSRDPAPAAPTAAESPSRTPPPQPQVPAIEPEYAVEIVESTTEPRTYTVKWSAKVNTGGWTLKTDNVLVEEHNAAMACRIWATLEQPNPSATVTQAIETLTGQHDAGTTKIERVEFSIRRGVQGVKPDFQPTYSVVKTIKYPY